MYTVVYEDIDFLGYHGEKRREYDSMSPARYYAEAYGPGTKIFHGGKLYYVVGEDGKIHKP
jgi:hypothetical protein